MNHFWLKIINFFTFGLINKKINANIKKINENKNKGLKLNTIAKPDIGLFLEAFGGKSNIFCVNFTISSLTIKVKDLKLVNFKKISCLTKKGINQMNDTFILLLGDCCQDFAADLKKEINQ